VRGTGLGLSISKTLVEHWSGRLTVESNPGEGSCFSIQLPDVDATEED
jgi:signal transduction histidine kinase